MWCGVLWGGLERGRVGWGGVERSGAGRGGAGRSGVMWCLCVRARLCVFVPWRGGGGGAKKGDEKEGPRD